jgi:hypothetical protein
MQQRTDLSAGQINGNDHLRVELIGPGDEPPFVAITWPPPDRLHDSHVRRGGR